MSQSPSGLPSADDLQFTTVEPAVAEGASAPVAKQACVVCRQPIDSTYFAIAGKVLCPKCCAQVQAPPGGSGAARAAKAAIMGLGAGLAGAVIWFAIRRVAHLQIGLVAIVVGFMVGKSVRKGSAGLGGRGYQVLAVVLTYCCIAANYMPDLYEAYSQAAEAHESKVAGQGGTKATRETIVTNALVSVYLFGFSLTLPVRMAAERPIGLLIIGFALWEAWKLTARRTLPITGPYYIAMPQGGAVASGAGATPDSEVII